MAMPGITVGVDASDNSERALEWAMREGAARKQPVTAIAVHEVAANQWSGSPIVLPGDRADEEKIRQAVEEKVARIGGKLGGDAPEVTVVVVSGIASQVLIDASKQSDQMVVASRGAGGFARLLVGSVSNQLVHHSECTVTIVK
jgi:nucleotide-binding universal stress UspA family protein